MRRLIAAGFVATAGAFAFAVACASAGTPPGGPEDHSPPVILSITPDSGDTNVKIKSVEYKFDEVVSDRPVGAAQLDQIFLISPRNGQPTVSWHRTRIDVRPKNGFRPNIAYRVTMLPGIVDLRSNAMKSTTTIVFYTGPYVKMMSLLGRVFDWSAQRVVTGAYIEAVWHSDTSVVYLAASDTLGEFDLGPLPPGTYTVRAIMDQNNNRILDRNEKWDTTTVDVENTRPHVELKAIERDSTPPSIESITPLDSVHVRISFDKYVDPRLPLQPALVRMQRADSSLIEVGRVQWAAEYDRQKLALDSARRADSIKALPPPPTPAAPPPTPPPAAAPEAPAARTPPPPAKPSAPPPERAIVVTISPPAQFIPTQTYRVTTLAIRNLVGNSREQTRTFTVPKPAPPPIPKPPADTTKKPPATRTDTTRKPPRTPPPGTAPPRPPRGRE